MHVQIYTDGGARGNPGPAATGIIIKDKNGKLLAGYGEYLGKQTNNFAEYSAFISALKKAKELGVDTADCFLDSKLIVEQLNGRWKVKEPTLQKLFVQAFNSASQLKKVTYKHIYREINKEADSWVNKILDQQ